MGNPNVGKSTVFNRLTGMNQHTGNWPGKTVGSAAGKFSYKDARYNLVDLPGTYSLFANSAEEEVTRDFIYGNFSGKPDLIIAVCDATCLERNLNLVLQTVEVNPNVILCLNLIDEAEKKQIYINIEKLENLLNVPVVPLSAAKNKGFTDLLETVYNMKKTLKFNSGIKSHNIGENPVEAINRAGEICKETVTFKNADYNANDRKIDKILTSKGIGIPVMLLLLTLIFWLTITGSNYPSALLADFLFFIQDKLLLLFKRLNAPEWLSGALIMGVYRNSAWVVAVMLPPMAIFFPLFTLLEDFGYLPRVAFNLDRAFQKCRACGKQALTMCMGFGCNAAGITGCRIINSPRERLIAILTNNFVPCNGRFPPPFKGQLCFIFDNFRRISG
jgi:ferrous iron transport protein B